MAAIGLKSLLIAIRDNPENPPKRRTTYHTATDAIAIRDTTEAHAAPSKPMFNTKIKIGSKIAFTTPATNITTIDNLAAP